MYKVRLESRAALRRIEASIVVRPGETAQLDMALSLGVWITGRVVLENGTAVSDARIHAAVTGLEGTDLQPWTKLCDCWTRRFDCFGIPPGNVTLVVTKPGYLPTQWSAGTLAEGDSVEDAVIVLKKGSAIAGRVHWPAGITPTRCEIAAHQHLDGDWVIPATALLSTNVWTREDGTFEIGGLGPSAVDLDTSVRVEIADPKTLRGLGLEGAAAAAPSTDHEREGAVAPKPKRVRFAATAQAITPGSTGVVLELHPVE
jgi:hypothetical protein